MVKKYTRFVGWHLNKFSTLVDFNTKESRWEFTAILFGISLFIISLFPAFYALSISPNGGVAMSPFLILAWLFLGIGVIGLIYVGFFVLYFRKHPPAEDLKIIGVLESIDKRLSGIEKRLKGIEKGVNKNGKRK